MNQSKDAKTEMKGMSEKDRIQVPAVMIPSFRTQLALNRGVEKNLLFKTWGGLGDQICAEPTIRYAMKSFKGCDISLASETPELFSHLAFKNVFNLKEVQPIWENYYTFDTIYPPSHLQWEFMSHMIINCVDYVSLVALRSQLPVVDREVKIPVRPLEAARFPAVKELFNQRKPIVAVHAGRHWPIKTFPAEWWGAVLSELRGHGVTPLLIGANTDDNRGTVDVNANGCIDLRNQCSITETLALLQHHTDVLLTNDSSPLHMAVTGNAWIGFIATCKHPDMIMHWRKGAWAWQMENLGLGGIWDVLDHCPNKENEVKVDNCDDTLLRSWLPKPEDFAGWAKGKIS